MEKSPWLLRLNTHFVHSVGPPNVGFPLFFLIGYPNVTSGPGFRGPRAGYLYLTDTSQGPGGLSRPEGLTPERIARRENYLASLRQTGAELEQDSHIHDYATTIEQSLKLRGPGFSRVFQLAEERGELRERYGSEFGQRCLLARRLVEHGVRFVEVSHNMNFANGTGWDAHNTGVLQQHELIRDLDQAVATLIMDLESRRMLDKTLIVIATEFGRPPVFDGGGLRHRGAYGETGELARKPVANAVSVPDFFATIHAALGIDITKDLHEGDRPIPITDRGQPIAKLFA